MASRTVLSDDFDGTIVEDVETVHYTYGGKSYEIDLGVENRKELDELMAQYIEASRPATATVTSGRSRTRALTRRAGPESDASVVRNWALANGHDVPKRGRISKDVLDAYAAAGSPGVGA